ncbi:glycoside hydrolase family protein [Chryseobacterium daecheongense]|uniref:glycoside hydrolase family protein n=1 Tax=Chryseobacterium daecheongense TaxID=192389 RepID=UPI001FD680B8|nr:glycoside hydrolase family protein [Chryseobacterium daecheongense]UOU98486.1 glycoside hydrolase family protein [Chryseobacterium daecheongense]
MSKRGVSKISGNPTPKVGEKTTYTITDWYSGTPKEKRNPALVTWELFKKRPNGRFTTTNIKKTGDGSFTFGEVAQKHTYRLEAYLYEAEGRGSSTIEINPQPVEVPKINKVELFYVDDTKGSVFSYMEKLVAKAQCVNLTGQKLTFTLWEDDANGDKHNANNLVIETKQGTVGRNGEASVEFQLTKALMQKAMKGETDQKELEFYVTVEYYRNKKHATNNVDVQNPLAFEIPKDKPKPKPQPQQQQSKPAAPPKAQGSPAAQKPESEKEKKGIIDKALDLLDELWDNGEAKGTIKPQQKPTPPAAGGKSTTTMEEVKIEALLDAYFAKEEYIKETGEEDGTHTYTFGGTKKNNKTSTADEKSKVAQAILGKVKESLKSQKKYTTVDTIISVLTAEAYGKDTTNEKTVTFKTFKLGADFRKINSAQLSDKVYLVARTMLLDGKKVTISIKEKDGLIRGSADALFPVLEITEEQMKQKITEEISGTEKIEFSGMVKDNMVKIPIHLRPKSDEELKQWKEKIAKGKEDGTYTYTFGGPTNIKNDKEKKSIAGIILSNAKAGKRGNPKIEDGKTSTADEIEKVLEIKEYKAGNTITFKLYKKIPELLYLHAKAQGEKQHDKEFLKKEGAYFQIGKSKYIIFPLRIKPRNDINGPNKKDYWAESKTNQTTYEYDRDGGARKHAARDLETDSNETVVAIAGGVVLEAQAFYRGTHQVTVHHKIPDGREFIVRYGELDPNSLLVSKGDEVVQGQELGKTGKMTGISRYMVHFELYTGSEGFEVVNYRLTQEGNPPFNRRKDLIDPLEILQEGYRNTFENGDDDGDRVDPKTLNFSQNGLNFLKGYEQPVMKDGKHVYFNDDYGFCTIGYGHLIAGKNSCENITIPSEFVNGLDETQATALLFQDVQRISNLVKSKVTVNLYQYEFDALVSLAFNVEASVGSDSTLLRKLNAEDYEGAANEFKNWRMAGGVVSPGLVKRRAQETDIFKNNIYDSTH